MKTVKHILNRIKSVVAAQALGAEALEVTGSNPAAGVSSSIFVI